MTTPREFAEEKLVNDIEQKPCPSEVSPVFNQEKKEDEWDVDEEAIFGSPLLEPSPKRNDSSLMVGGEATPNDLSENVTPEPQHVIPVDADMVNRAVSFVRANSASLVKFNRDPYEKVEQGSDWVNCEVSFVRSHSTSPVQSNQDRQEKIDDTIEQGAKESLDEDMDSSDAEKSVVELASSAFDCQYCGKRWEKLGSLNKHITSQHRAERTMLLKSEEPTFVPCEIDGCGSSFLSQKALQNHIIIAHEEGVESDLNNTLEDETELGNYVENADVEGPTDEFHCQFCGRGFAKMGSVNKHIASKHRAERAKLNKSLDSNAEDILLSCTIAGCTSTFVSHQARQNHLSLAHNEEVSVETVKSDVFACPYCPREYTVYGSLHSHYIRNHRSKPRFSIANSRKGTGEDQEDNYESDREASPETSAAVRRSFGEKPEASTRHCCNYCTATFDSLEKKVAHEKSKHSQDMDCCSSEEGDLNSFPCEHDGCERIFTSKKARSSHIVRAHRDNKAKHEFACEYCEKSYDNSGALQVHVQRTHPYEVALRMRNAPEHFACPHCPNKYERLNTLRTHLWRSHPKQPKYTRAALRKSGGGEVEEVHEKEPRLIKNAVKAAKPEVQKKNESSTPSVDLFKCDVCHKPFASLVFLDKHKLTHAIPETTKPFCDVCGQVFKGIQYVLRHKNATICGQSENRANSDVKKEKTSVENTPSTGLRKRRRETLETNESVLQYGESEDCSPPKTKRPLIVKQEQFVSPSLGNLHVKTEPFDAHEYRFDSPLTYVANIIVPQTLAERNKSQPSVKSETTWNNVLRSADRNNSVRSRKSDIKTPGQDDIYSENGMESPANSRPGSRLIAASPSIASGQTSRRCSVVNNQENIGMADMTFDAVGGEVETSPLPLSTAIFTRAAQFASEIMVVWSAALEDDLLAAANMNSANTIVCVQELEVLNLPEQAKDILKKSHMVSFTMLTSCDTTSQWTVITFGEQVPPASLKQKLFKQFQSVESIFAQQAATRGMDVINIMRYSKDGLFPTLSKSFAKKTIGFNHQQ